MNFAGVRRLPVVFMIDNNQFAYSTPTHLEFAIDAPRRPGRGLRLRGRRRRRHRRARGVPRGAARRSRRRARRRPDAARVRDAARWRATPCTTTRSTCRARCTTHGRRPTRSSASGLAARTSTGSASDEDASVRERGEGAAERRARARGASPLPDPATALDGVVGRAGGARHAASQDRRMAIKTYLQAISDGLREEMRRDERVFVIGEDVGVYGGAFKVTQGFQAEFGPWRVLDAPLAETAIVGACTGAAMMGMRPVAEMQFADFISCAWDHLVTVAAKQHYRTGAAVPFVVRCPSGGGFSGGPFHSQNPESSFAHIPGLKIVCPSTPEDAKGLLIGRSATRTRCCTSSTSTSTGGSRARCPTSDCTTPFGKARVAPRGRRPDDRDVGRDGLHGRRGRRQARRGGRHLGRGASTCARSSRGTARRCWRPCAHRKLLVLHEDTRTARLRRRDRGDRRARRRSRRSTARSRGWRRRTRPVPFSPPLEKRFIPQVDDVLAGARASCGVLSEPRSEPWQPEPRSTWSCPRWA